MKQRHHNYCVRVTVLDAFYICQPTKSSQKPNENRYCYSLHFTDEQTEAEKTCPTLNSWEVAENQILETGGLAPDSVLLISILLARTQHMTVRVERAGAQGTGRDPTICCGLATQPGANFSPPYHPASLCVPVSWESWTAQL